MDLVTELRRHPRHAVHGWTVWIEWRDGDRGIGASAELVNISREGALTLAPVLPRVGQAVTLLVEDLGPWPRIPAVVVLTRSGQLGHQVHLEFRVPCPEAMLAALVVARAASARGWGSFGCGLFSNGPLTPGPAAGRPRGPGQGDRRR